MKKIFMIVIAIVFITSIFANVETIAKDVLTAYKNRDADNLRKNASDIMKNAINDSYFEDKNVQSFIETVDNWNGKFKEIRYNSGDMMGKKIYLASLYFADVPDDKNKIYTVVLSSLDKNEWVMFGSGIVAEKREEFENMNLSLSDDEEKMEEKAKTEVIERKNFSMEMANGDTYKKVTEQLLVENINKLDDDNFFLILNCDSGFLQAAYSTDGYSVQYNENEKQFEADKLLSKEETINIFKEYFNGTANWKEGLNWVVF